MSANIIPFPRFAYLRTLPTEELERLWDEWDGDDDPQAHRFEAIEAELDRRNAGSTPARDAMKEGAPESAP